MHVKVRSRILYKRVKPVIAGLTSQRYRPLLKGRHTAQEALIKFGRFGPAVRRIARPVSCAKTRSPNLRRIGSLVDLESVKARVETPAFVYDKGAIARKLSVVASIRAEAGCKVGMVQKRPFSGNTWALSAHPDRSRVGAGLRESLAAVLGLQFRENRVYPRSSSQ